jgi:hypothetical protein
LLLLQQLLRQHRLSQRRLASTQHKNRRLIFLCRFVLFPLLMLVSSFVFVQLSRQREVLVEGADALRQRLASLRAELSSSNDEGHITEITKRLKQVRTLLGGEGSDAEA